MVRNPSPDRVRLSWSRPALQRYSRGTLAPISVRCSLSSPAAPCFGSGRGLRVPSSAVSQACPAVPLLSFGPPTEVYRVSSGQPSVARSEQTDQHPPLRFGAPTAFPRMEQRHRDRTCLIRSPASSGFLNLVTPSIRPMPAGPISDRIRSWGSPSRALFLPPQPCAVSSAAPLMPSDRHHRPRRVPRHSVAPRRAQQRARHVDSRQAWRPSASGSCSAGESATMDARFRCRHGA